MTQKVRISTRSVVGGFRSNVYVDEEMYAGVYAPTKEEARAQAEVYAARVAEDGGF